MSTIQETPVTGVTSPTAPPHRNGRWAGYTHLLMARMLELKREPEVVFWVFVFPLLLALGLGIAFRNKPGDAASVAIVAGTGVAGCASASRRIRRSMNFSRFKMLPCRRSATRISSRQVRSRHRARRQGRPRIPLRSGASRERAGESRGQRRAAGRRWAQRCVATTVVTSSEPGSRYIDFLIPGLLGMNLMNSGMWGIGFALVDMRQRKLLKRSWARPCAAEIFCWPS